MPVGGCANLCIAGRVVIMGLNGALDTLASQVG